MDFLTFDYQTTSLISRTDINNKFSQLLTTIEQITAAHSTEYTTEYASINLPFDKALFQTITATVKEKKNTPTNHSCGDRHWRIKFSNYCDS